MTKRTTDWINIEQPDGKKMIAAPSYINKLLGVDKNEADIFNLFSRMRSLENKVHRLESPERQQRVIDLLSQEDERSRMFTWLSNRIRNLDYQDMSSLVSSGVISEEKAGRNTMFYLTSRDTHETRSN